MNIHSFYTPSTTHSFLCIMLTAAFSAGCGVKGSGHVVEERHDTEHFSAIDLGDGFVGRVEQGYEYSVVVEADDNLIDDVRVRVNSGVLTVDLDDKWVRDATLRATFTMPILAEAFVSDGSILSVATVPLDEHMTLDLAGGSIARLTQLPGERFEWLMISSSGGSSFDISALANNTLVDISGGGTGTLAGSGAITTVYLSGGSSLAADGFLSELLDFDFSGGSSAEIAVRSQARGELSGGSVLEVYGEAEVNAEKSGGSSVVRRD